MIHKYIEKVENGIDELMEKEIQHGLSPKNEEFLKLLFKNCEYAKMYAKSDKAAMTDKKNPY